MKAEPKPDLSLLKPQKMIFGSFLFYGTDSAAWDFSVLDNDDEDEPYEFSAGTVTLAGPTNNLALRNAINADSTVIAMLVDSSHPQIDIANLSTRDLALEVGATATLPGLTASGGAELVDPVPLLALADFDGAGLDTSPALALLMRGDASNGAGIWGRGPRAVSGSALLDGEFDLPPSDEPINLIRFRDSGSDYGSERISFHDNGPLHLGTYFSSGDGSDLTLWIQTGTGAADIAEIPMQANYDRGGGNFAIIDVPAQYQSIVGSIDPGRPVHFGDDKGADSRRSGNWRHGHAAITDRRGRRRDIIRCASRSGWRCNLAWTDRRGGRCVLGCGTATGWRCGYATRPDGYGWR